MVPAVLALLWAGAARQSARTCALPCESAFHGTKHKIVSSSCVKSFFFPVVVFLGETKYRLMKAGAELRPQIKLKFKLSYILHEYIH